ncbi:UPF0149 family protein [Rhodoferax sp. GW822-FHT02A01]|uniref:UPF0149 family protein n=1 Tax=Rhodoferax sp. GW822-FHT02A01 TaxID=3141537 RepID=UPI00315CE0B6
MNTHTSGQTPDLAPAAQAVALSPEEFDEIDAILDDLRQRFEETPQWEFCEGFMAALIVSRRAIPLQEYLPVLLDTDDTDVAASAGAEVGGGTFADAAQYARFMELWQRRWSEIEQSLAVEVKSLDDERAYHPEVMDVRGAVAALPEAERAQMADEALPSFAQVWAVGFMYAVENWPDEWQPPRDKEARKWLDDALQRMVALTEDDTDEPTLSVFDDEGVPTVSVNRFNAFADAVWAVYDLRELWRNIGPRVETVHKEAEPGRNDPCYCGSGKKYKKCHGA